MGGRWAQRLEHFAVARFLIVVQDRVRDLEDGHSASDGLNLLVEATCDTLIRPRGPSNCHLKACRLEPRCCLGLFRQRRGGPAVGFENRLGVLGLT